MLAAAMTVAAGLQGGARTLVDDDHGTGLAATLLPIGHPLAGRLSDAGDVDAFRIDLAGAARIEVRTSGPTDTRGRLFDAGGRLRAEDDDSGSGGHNFRIAAALEPGVHYVEVRGAAGHYSVVAVLADEVDHGDTAAASTALAFPDESTVGSRAQDILLGASGRIWPTVSDVDVFRLDVPFEDHVFVRSSGNKSLRVSLVDSSLSDVVRSEIRTDRHGNIRTGEVLGAGTYYVVVGGDEVGAYRLLAERLRGPRPYSSCTDPSLATPRDVGSSPESSTLLVLGGSPAAGDIADDADVDVFRLDVHGRAQVEVRTSGGTPTRGELYDAGGALVASDEGGGPGGRNFRIERELATGVYYVAVKGAPGARGGYAVSARAGAAFDHPHVPRNATLLPLHDVLDLARATPDMLLGTPGRIWPSAADVDAFRLDVPRDGTVVRVRTSGGTALHARLVRAGEALAEVASDDRGGDVDLEAPLDAGVYYLLIGGRGTGAYRVLAWGYEAGLAPPDKAAFDALVAGKSLSALHLETVRFGSPRRFGGTLENAHRGGRYTYERTRCPDIGWLDLEYDDGGRCMIVLDFVQVDNGTVAFSCDGAPWTRSGWRERFWIFDGEIAQIHDRRLAAAVRLALCQQSGWDCDELIDHWFAGALLAEQPDPITMAHVASLESLDASGGRVRDLAGLEHATRLTSLNLSGNQISDLSPLANLAALRSLYLGYNDIADLSPLAGLAALRYLYVPRNRISDLSPLENLAALRGLDLGYNDIADLSPLADLTALRSLELDRNRISDLSRLSRLTALTWLELADNLTVTDLSPLAGLVSLTLLDLSGNRIGDLLPLAGLVSLTHLDLSGNRIADLSPLSDLAALEWLQLADNGVRDLRPLAGLAGLRLLDLANNLVSDPWPLAGLTALEWLNLDRNGISDLSPLAGLDALSALHLSGNRIADLSPLSGLWSGDPPSHGFTPTLDLSYNEVSDLRPLADLSLVRLRLDGNRISDLSALSTLTIRPTRASLLDLSGNHIRDVSPLSGVTVRELDLAHNEISDLTPFAGTSPLARFHDWHGRIGLQGNRIRDASPLTREIPANTRVDLGHNAIGQWPDFNDQPGYIDLAGNRIGSWPSNSEAYASAWYLNVEGNRFADAPPALPSRYLLLGGNAIGDITSLLGDARRPAGSSNLTVSLWRNPIDDGQLPELRGRRIGGGQLVPLFADAHGPGRRGILRLTNLGGGLTNLGGEGDAFLYAPRLGDDARPAAVVLPSRSVVHVDAEDIRQGARDKRVYGQLPIGSGDAVVEVYSWGDVAAHAYVRTVDGFLTSMHDTASADADDRHVVPLFNPASNTRQRSLLRLVNAGGEDAEISVTGVDDAGAHGGPVEIVLPARTATVLDADALENGTGAGLSGSLGDGDGRWRLHVSSDGDIAVMGLLDAPTGHLANLSTVAAESSVPLFLSASHASARAWVRVVNLGAATEVTVTGIDDAGTAFGPVALSVAAGHAAEFDSDDWENGNASKGLAGVGAGTGDWRLRFSSDGEILVGAYVETGDGFVSSMHGRVPDATEPGCWTYRRRWHRACHRSPPAFHAVAPFMPTSGDGDVRSSVRLVNDGEDDATIAIWRVDERGNRAGPVDLELAGGTARTVSARELVEGGEGIAGRLRNGAGTWELLVASSGERITVVNLLEDAFGHVTNLSTAPYHPAPDEYR